ncbi:AraC family transcriptional regulator [Cupriavidus sp. USMAA2-4]|nr:AraC family transcriptional regulator [Cupriavidus sp. USMAA2-4]
MTMSLPIPLFDAMLRGMVLALLALLAALLGRDRPALPAARAAAALAAGLAVQVASSMPWFEQSAPRLWQAPLVGIAVGNAALLWIFVQALFDDGFAFRPVHALAWAAATGLGTLNCAVLAHSGSAIAPFTTALQRVLPGLFAVLTMIAAAKGWRGDLIEGRRRLRAFIVIAGVAYTLLQLAARLASPDGRLSDAGATLDTALLLCIVAPLACSMLRMTATELFPSARAMAPPEPGPLPAPPPPPSHTAADATPARPETPPPTPSPAEALAAGNGQANAADAAEQALVNALLRLMADEQAYRSEQLSVASLAARLAVPEYRLRRAINQRLGYRNFSAFVNGFRLREAQAALSDPALRALPVLTIALEAGFQSIGPFNRAFKAATGATPSEYRRQKLADS